MNVKQELLNARNLKLEIQIKAERLEQLRAMAESTSAPIGFAPNGGSCGQDRLGNIVALIVDFQKEIQDGMQKLIWEQRRISKIISKIEKSELRVVLELYYLAGYKWRKVAETMGYSDNHVYKLHGKALLEFATKRIENDS